MSFRDHVDCLLGIAIPTLGEKKLTVLYRPKSGSAYKINAIFDADWNFVDADTEANVSTNELWIGVRMRDLRAKPQVFDRVTISKVNYLVKDIREDGLGGVELILNIDEKPRSNRE